MLEEQLRKEFNVPDYCKTTNDIINFIANDVFYNGYNKAREYSKRHLKEYLKKNRTNYPDFMNGTDAYAFGMKEGYVKAFDKIIYELFERE